MIPALMDGLETTVASVTLTSDILLTSVLLDGLVRTVTCATSDSVRRVVARSVSRMVFGWVLTTTDKL